MTSSAASIWSAIAASFSAIAALIVLRIQRINMLEASKPEIMLIGWERKKRTDSGENHEQLCFRSIKNIGRGPALHVYINSANIEENRPLAVLSTKRLSILPAGEEQEIKGQISLFWQNVSERDGTKYLPIEIEVFSWCSRNYRHRTVYKLMVIQSANDHVNIACDEIAPGVMMSTRQTTSKPVWLIKLYSKLSNLPFIRKFMSRG